MGTKNNIIVAIPVKNEEALIRPCLDRMIHQTRSPTSVILLLNNCTDFTLDICRDAQRANSNIIIETCELPAVVASAGEARRRVLDLAMTLAGDGLILTTDADALPDITWIADNLAEIEAGADVVCGMAAIDKADNNNIPRRLQFDDMREKLLLQIIDEITALVDPEPADPWPRHQQNSGASIALKAELLRRIGGAPHVPSGEDRALIERLGLIDARIRHTPSIQVSVSGRLEGRAAGGMAETIKRRILMSDEVLDDTIEPVVDAYRRAMARAGLRAVWNGNGDCERLAKDLLISTEALCRASGLVLFWGSMG